jgi:hypothetical protein
MDVFAREFISSPAPFLKRSLAIQLEIFQVKANNYGMPIWVI